MFHGTPKYSMEPVKCSTEPQNSRRGVSNDPRSCYILTVKCPTELLNIPQSSQMFHGTPKYSTRIVKCSTKLLNIPRRMSNIPRSC